ncbi:MAG TPA: phosphatidylglycerophosphatase A [Opitutaceae bacterium]|nr:phosphatidylglycerophosphatase A [Opitutaceae bacterium]
MNLRQPGWTRTWPTATVLNIARLGPVGGRLRAPGTWGSLAGVLFFWLCFRDQGEVVNVIGAACAAYFAVGVCGEAEIRLGRRDPGEVILDEVVAMPLCFVGWGWLVGSFPAWLVVLLGFAIFRFYDIRKPMMINTLQELPGGWGIVADDVAAALATCATLHVIHMVWVLV